MAQDESINPHQPVPRTVDRGRSPGLCMKAHFYRSVNHRALVPQAFLEDGSPSIHQRKILARLPRRQERPPSVRSFQWVPQSHFYEKLNSRGSTGGTPVVTSAGRREGKSIFTPGRPARSLVLKRGSISAAGTEVSPKACPTQQHSRAFSPLAAFSCCSPVHHRGRFERPEKSQLGLGMPVRRKAALFPSLQRALAASKFLREEMPKPKGTKAEGLCNRKACM